jgi:hypothetical protein
MKALIDIHSHLGQINNSSMSAGGAGLRDLHRKAGITHAEISLMVVAHPDHLAASPKHAQTRGLSASSCIRCWATTISSPRRCTG